MTVNGFVPLCCLSLSSVKDSADFGVSVLYKDDERLRFSELKLINTARISEDGTNLYTNLFPFT